MVLFGAVGLAAAGFALLVAQRAGAAPADIGDCFQLDGAGCIEGATDLAGTASGAIGGVSTALGGPDEWLKSIVTSAGEAVELSFGLSRAQMTGPGRALNASFLRIIDGGNLLAPPANDPTPERRLRIGTQGTQSVQPGDAMAHPAALPGQSPRAPAPAQTRSCWYRQCQT